MSYLLARDTARTHIPDHQLQISIYRMTVANYPEFLLKPPLVRDFASLSIMLF